MPSPKKSRPTAGHHAHNIATIVTIVLTFIFFVLALFVKGIPHDLLLEAAVFLISVKIILGMMQIKKMSEMMEAKLEKIEEGLEQTGIIPEDEPTE